MACCLMAPSQYLHQCPLQWYHTESHGISDHQHLDCLLSCLFRCTSKKTSRGCVFSVYPLPLWWLREYIYTLSYYHHQIGSIGLGHETMVCAVCLSIFLGLPFTDPCEENPLINVGFPTQRASDVSIWWHHHATNHRWGPMTITWGHIHNRYLNCLFVWKLLIWN